MILYDQNLKHSFSDFGIEIPVRDSRARRTFDGLTSHATIGPQTDRWHIPHVRETITREDLQRVHAEAYVAGLYSDALENEIIKTYELIDEQGKYFRYNPENATLPLTRLYDIILHRVAGTAQCLKTALEKRFCFFFGGGMHHAHFDHGSGFCLVNDIVTAIRKYQAQKRIRTAWVIDVDAHKGDGTADLTCGDESIKTLSIHMAKGWPLEGPEYDTAGNLNPAFIPSDVDIPIAAGEEQHYNARLKSGLEQLQNTIKPDIAVVVSGSDPYELDELPSTAELRLSLEQLNERDRLVYSFLKQRDIPAAYLMAGGYGESSWKVYLQFLEWVLVERLG